MISGWLNSWALEVHLPLQLQLHLSQVWDCSGKKISPPKKTATKKKKKKKHAKICLQQTTQVEFTGCTLTTVWFQIAWRTLSIYSLSAHGETVPQNKQMYPCTKAKQGWITSSRSNFRIFGLIWFQSRYLYSPSNETHAPHIFPPLVLKYFAKGLCTWSLGCWAFLAWVKAIM